MIDVQDVIQHIPTFDTFCSVETLSSLATKLQRNPRFEVRELGKSRGGRPIHHIRFGFGSVKALFLGFPHCCEPIGGMTVYSLLTLLEKGIHTLLNADVEWHFIPCADPDGALLNEKWTQSPTFEAYLQNYYLQPIPHQAAMSFPIQYKKMRWDAPSHEAQLIMALFGLVRPDFYYTLHNTRAGGVFFGLSANIESSYHTKLHQLMSALKFPVQKRAPYKEICHQFAEGISEVVFMRRLYDYIERTSATPESYPILRSGGSDWDYLAEHYPTTLSMYAETGCLRHPYDQSEAKTTFNLRHLRLTVDANSKHLASVLFEEWVKLKHSFDCSNPYFLALEGYLIQPLERIAEGGWPLSRYPTLEILTDKENDRLATEGEVFNVCVMDGGLYYIQFAYQFLRLIDSSNANVDLTESRDRVAKALERTRGEIGRYIDLAAFDFYDLGLLAKVQVASGLTVLNSILAKRSQAWSLPPDFGRST